MQNRKKSYILGVFCNRICFGELEEEVLGQCRGQVSQHLEKRSICLSVACSTKKQARCLRKCLWKCSIEVSRFVFEILEKSKVIAMTFDFSVKVCYTLWKSQSQKRGPLNYVVYFLDHPWKFHAFSNSLKEILHAITSNRNQFHVLKPIVWFFLLE